VGDDGVDHGVAPGGGLEGFREAGVGEHPGVEGEPGEVAELLADGLADLGGVGVDGDRAVGDEGRRGTVGGLGGSLEGWKGGVAEIGPGGYPAYGGVGMGAAELVGLLPQGGGHDGHGSGSWDGGVGVVVAAVKVHFAFMKQGFNDLYVFFEVGQGFFEVKSEGCGDAGFVAGAEAESKSTAADLMDDEGLHGDGDGVLGPDGGDGGP